jgi:antitoxin component YwqK of YwqJK toxin-antitoxin module
MMTFGETIKDLVERNGLYYKKFTVVPFTGNLTGKSQGTIRNGKKEGLSVFYYDYPDAGQLLWKGNYKDGKREGPWVYHHENGQLLSKTTYKDGDKVGP